MTNDISINISSQRKVKTKMMPLHQLRYDLQWVGGVASPGDDK